MDATLATINKHLAAAGISITREDATMLADLRAKSLAEVERIEFGMPAAVVIAEEIAASPYVSQGNAAHTLATLQSTFYAARDELPVDVPDTEIIEALRSCLDELGEAAEVKALPTEELMGFSKRYREVYDAERETEYRIVDDDGRAYVFDAGEWDYDEMAPGWDGEEWADEWRD